MVGRLQLVFLFEHGAGVVRLQCLFAPTRIFLYERHARCTDPHTIEYDPVLHPDRLNCSESAQRR
jgi:hypothetical protein